jgi:hypothetical protein
MKRVLAVTLALSVVAHPLVAEGPVLDWQSKAIKAFRSYEKLGSDAFILGIEKETQQKLTSSDAAFLREKLGQVYKNSSALNLQVKQSQEKLLISWSKNSQTLLSFDDGKEPLIKLDGKVLPISSSDGIEEISKKVWALLASQNGWGPYPASRKTSASFWLNLILPQAHADNTGTYIAIAIAVAVIGALAYLTYKSGKSIDKAGDAAAKAVTKVGDSAASGIERVSGSAARTLDAATETLNTANDTLKETQSSLKSVTDNANQQIKEINSHTIQLPTEH